VEDRTIRKERSQNIWSSFGRKFEAVAQATQLDPLPEIDLANIGGLAAPKEEIQTYACAATNPDVYQQWGTFPPTGILLIGNRGVGKRLLAKALASLTNTAFLTVNVPRFVIEVIHRGSKVGELVAGWSQAFEEMPPVTVLFHELEFSQTWEFGGRRTDLPVGPVMDFLLDIIDRSIASENALVVGSTSHPSTLRQAFADPRRFERVVEVTPQYPDDVVAALTIHAADAEKRAGRKLFEAVDWRAVVAQHRDPPTGDWIRILHGVLRRKARHEACGDTATNVTTQDLLDEVARYRQVSRHLVLPEAGNYV
jgi:ATP-dependent 26S proteasome regulatory subunit